jgi:hypothetical protein
MEENNKSNVNRCKEKKGGGESKEEHVIGGMSK